jgi:hypothetical protein
VVKIPDSTIASYCSTVKRASGEGIQSATAAQGRFVIVDMAKSPWIRPLDRW